MVTRVLEVALREDQYVANAEKLVVERGYGEFIEPERIELPKTPGLEVESEHVSASVGLHVVLGRNHAGKTRLLRTIAAGKFSLTARLSKLIATSREPLTDDAALRDLTFTFTWSRSGMDSYLPASQPKVGARLAPEDESMLQARGSMLTPSFGLRLADFVERRVRIRPAVVVPTERYLRPTARLDSMPGLLDDLDSFPSILENLQRDVSTRPLYAKIHEAFRDVSEGLSLDFLVGKGLSHLHIVEQDRTLVPIEDCGDGLRDLLVILSYVHVYERCDLMLDEPGLRLHPHAQRRLLRYLEGASRQRAIWIASHDGVFVGAPSVRSRHLVTRDPASRVSSVSALPAEAQVRRAVAHLGWVPRDALLAERVLLCEGPADVAVFRAVLALLRQ